MLSYRHAFHAGNHADVLKHAVLIHSLDYLLRKDKAVLYLDTHAGAGGYDLASGFAEQIQEYRHGVSRIIGQDGLPPLLRRYAEVVQAANPGREVTFYPGSPLIAWRLLRPCDPLRLHELHPADFAALQEAIPADPQVTILQKDGLGGLVRALPPPSRRGLTLIDPAYEVKTDYGDVPNAVARAVERFATGTYMVWYPLLETGAYRELKAALQRVSGPKWLWVELQVRSHGGLFGSGCWVINPAWDLPDALRAAEPALVGLLGQDGAAALRIECALP